MKFRRLTYIAITTLLAALTVASSMSAEEPSRNHRSMHYRVISLGTPLGGSVSGTAAINNLGWIAGDSNLAGDLDEHAVLWLYGFPLDLGTLGGPNSAVLWPGLNNFGQVVGISDKSDAEPNGESWSCGNFFPASHSGHECVGFFWQLGVMTPLPTLGGYNGFATGINNHGQAVGWAENSVHDSTCVTPQVLQFEAVVWTQHHDQFQAQVLPPYPTDPDGAATSINDHGQVVGISGICQNAVGNRSAIHALLWQNGSPIDLGNLGGKAWNTPMALNNQGQVVGFSDLTGDQDGDNPNFQAFLWTRNRGMQNLHTLPGDAISEALGINEQAQIVGVSYAAGFATPRAFLWQNNAMVDLNTLAPNSPLYLQAAQEINDSGVIVGQGCRPGACSGSDPSIAFVAIPTWDRDDEQPSSSYAQGPPAGEPASRQLLQHLGLAGMSVAAARGE